MHRLLVSGLALAVLAPAAAAQDMPLSQILIDGEGWKSAGPPGVKTAIGPHANTADRRGKLPIALTTSPDGGTLFAGYADCRAVRAFRVGKDGVPEAGGAYCPLRLPENEGETSVTALTTDKDGRIYAATPIGIQVFDPTGRLCGVVELPRRGATVEYLIFEGDQLQAWTADTRFTRKLKTTGVP